MSSAHTETIISTSGRLAHFLGTKCTYSEELSPGAQMGHSNIEHSVFVFTQDSEPLNKNEGDVVLKLSNRGFSLQEYLTPSEARTLAYALNCAADHKEASQAAAQKTAANAPDEVPA
jgi:hypothetical protein